MRVLSVCVGEHVCHALIHRFVRLSCDSSIFSRPQLATRLIPGGPSWSSVTCLRIGWEGAKVRGLRGCHIEHRSRQSTR